MPLSPAPGICPADLYGAGRQEKRRQDLQSTAVLLKVGNQALQHEPLQLHSVLPTASGLNLSSMTYSIPSEQGKEHGSNRNIKTDNQQISTAISFEGSCMAPHVLVLPGIVDTSAT